VYGTLLQSKTNAFASFLEKKKTTGRRSLWCMELFCEAELTLLLLFWKRRRLLDEKSFLGASLKVGASPRLE
jgi:hypothetical protein